MRSNLRALIVALSCAFALPSASGWAADAKKTPAAAPKAGETAVADQKVKGFQKKKEVKKEEKKKPASFTADMGEGVEIDSKADQKRDEQIEQLKKIIPKVQGPQKADLLFQLAELWWSKSKFVAHKGIAKYDEALAKWMEKTNKGEQAGPEPKFEQFTREGELYRQEALRKYEEILRDFPTYERKDEVLFAFAYNKAEIGQKEEAIAKYNELIKQYPQSKYVPDAYVQMGEYFFNTNQLSKARTAYEKALASNNPNIKYFALYKLGWCDYNAGAYEESIKKFKEVIANAKVEKGGTGLKTEALNDIVTSFAQLDAVDEAIGYFKKSTGKDNARRLIAKLAEQYQTAGKHDASVKSFRQLINDDPNDPRCPEFQNAIIVSYEGLRKRDMVAKEMHRLVELYRPNTPWAKANAGNKGAIDTAYEITEGAMRTMVTEYHQEAQKTKAAETYRLARDIYKEYLDSFADSEFAYNLRYYYSDILWALNEFEPAAVQYMMVTDKDHKGQYSKMAAFNAILCYERLVDAEKKGKKIEEVTGKVDEKKAKDKIGKTTVKLVTHDKDVKEEEIPKWEARLVEAIDKSVGLYPGEADEITLRYKAAFVFYDHKHDIDAAKRFGEIINKWPNDQYSAKAADLTLNILETKQEWFELNKLAREFAANKKLVTNNKDFGNRVTDLVETSQYKYIDETVYKGQKDPAQAAVKFREFIAEFPKSKLAPQALLYAMIIHHEARQLDLSIDDGEKMLKEYPEGKGVDGKDLIGRTMLYLGSFYEKTSDFKTAASFYEKFVDRALGTDKKDPKAKKAEPKKAVAEPPKKGTAGKGLSEEETKIADALYNAALWNEGLGNFDHAIALYSRYIEKWPGKKDVADIFFNIGLIYEKQKNLKDAAKIFKGYADQYGKDITPSKLYYAKYREMLALRELKQDKEAAAKIDELVKSYEKLPAADKTADQTLNAYAHARFLTLEPKWREYSGVKFDNVSRLKKDLTEKLKLVGDPDKGTGITGEYARVLAIGSGDWGIAAMTRIGMAYQDFAKNLIDSPDPRGLDEDQLAMYRGELENRAFPLEEKAIDAYEKALSKGMELSVYNEWTLKAQDQINKFKPGAFLEPHDVPFLGAERFATAPGMLTETPKVAAAEPAKAEPAKAAEPAADPKKPAEEKKAEPKAETPAAKK
jgi:tetratricopeptide (TPR) repeat protein